MSARPMPYTLTLTEDERRALEWLADRGYACRLIEEATEIEYPDDGGAVYRYTEADAWNAIHFAGDDQTDGGAIDDDPDYGTCAGPSLLRKMLAFRDGIV